MIERLIRTVFAKPAAGRRARRSPASPSASSAFLDLPRDVFPDLSAPVFNVIVQNPAMGAEELETGIAVPHGGRRSPACPHVRRIRSSSQLGVCQVTIEFEPDADYYRARQLVAERVAQATPQLPPGTDAAAPVEPDRPPQRDLRVHAGGGARHAPTSCRCATWPSSRSATACSPCPASRRSRCLGGHLRQFQVQLDPDRMAARGVTLDEVRARSRRGERRTPPAASWSQGSDGWAVRAVGPRRRASRTCARRSWPCAAARPVLLGDVADVREDAAVRRGIAHRLQGRGRERAASPSSSARTRSRWRAGVREARRRHPARACPKGVTLRMVYDQSTLVRVRARRRRPGRAPRRGASWSSCCSPCSATLRAALLVTLTIPLSRRPGRLFLHHAGVGINTMTLGGLAIAVGLLVDASIIMTENITPPPLDRPSATPACGAARSPRRWRWAGRSPSRR